VGHAPTDHGAEGGIVQPSFQFLGSLCNGGVLRCPGGGGGCGDTFCCPLCLSVVVSSSLLGISSVGEWPAIARRACQDGRGPQSAGWSGSGVEG
jgi:hypothetical protein